MGRSVELPCIASGYPNPTIRWLKDGRPLPADSRWTRRLTGLTVSDLRLEDSGNYICEVTNSFGSKEVTGHLNVIGEEPGRGERGGGGEERGEEDKRGGDRKEWQRRGGVERSRGEKER